MVTKSDSSSVHNVRDYGAAGDGKTDDTNVIIWIQKPIYDTKIAHTLNTSYADDYKRN